MLDAFKKPDPTRQTEELQALIAASKEERAALSTMLTQVQVQSGRLAAAAKTVQEVEDNAGKAHARLDEVNERLAASATRVSELEHIDARITALAGAIAHAEDEMVRVMEAQINKVNEGARQAARTDDLIDRVEKLAREVGGQLDAGLRARDAFAADLVTLDKDRGALTEFVRRYMDTLTIERREFEAFDQRVKGLRAVVADAEKSMEALGVRDRLAAAIAQKVDQLSTDLQALHASAADLARKQATLDGLNESLGQVDELARQTARRYESLEQGRQDLNALRREIQDVYTSHATAVQLCDRLTADRASLEVFLERATAFRTGLPDLDSRIASITSKLGMVEEGTQQAANLVSLADDLDRQMDRVIAQQQFVERVEARLNTLGVLAGDVDRKLDEQIARGGEVEGLRNQVDGVTIAVTDARQKLEAVIALQVNLIPLTAQFSTLKGQIDKAHARFVAAQQEEAVLAAQETRLAEMLAAAQDVAGKAAERLRQIQGLAEDIDRSAKLKADLLQELAVVQARQRDVSSHFHQSEDQLERIETAVKGLERRGSQLASTEERLAAFEARAAELAQMTAELNAGIVEITRRGAVVEAVRNEAAAVQEVSERNKAVVDNLMESVARLAEKVREQTQETPR